MVNPCRLEIETLHCTTLTMVSRWIINIRLGRQKFVEFRAKDSNSIEHIEHQYGLLSPTLLNYYMPSIQPTSQNLEIKNRRYYPDFNWTGYSYHVLNVKWLSCAELCAWLEKWATITTPANNNNSVTSVGRLFRKS